jgi:hypothetical protein
MKMKYLCLAAAVAAGLALPLCAAPLTQSTFTEVIKNVQIVDVATKAATPAQNNDLLQAPNRVRTGPESRAELTAPDRTITRIGANSVFSFEDSGRTLNLEQGNVLFHAPKGIGGGTIKSGGAIAAVLGTTLIASATKDGGFKVILLEGTGKVTLANGKTVTLHAGQLVFVQSGGKDLSPILTINLGKLVGGSTLVNGFSQPLSSLPLIQDAIQKQNQQLANGEAEDTGSTPEDTKEGSSPKLKPVAPGSYQVAVPPAFNPGKGTSAGPSTPGGGGRTIIPVTGPLG